MPSAIPRRDAHKYGDACPGGHGARPTDPGAPVIGGWLAVSTLLGRPVPVTETYPCRCELDGCMAGGFWAHCPCRGRTDKSPAKPGHCCTHGRRQ